MGKKLEESDFLRASKKLGCEVNVIKAVSKVEGNGSGFTSSDKPKTLFEGHVFWKELVAKGIDPNKLLAKNPALSNILYKKWTKIFYGKSEAEEEKRLNRAMAVDRECALRSASWGMFQILGCNHKLVGFKTLQEFINAMYKSEGSHLDAFINFVIKRGLDDELRDKRFADFALGYNGSGYAINRYDEKIRLAYEKFAGIK